MTNFIPTFFLSFLKMSVIVLEEDFENSKKIFVGCVRGGSKITWVRWY